MITITEENWSGICRQILNASFEVSFEQEREAFLITIHDETYELPHALARQLHGSWQIPVHLMAVLSRHGV